MKKQYKVVMKSWGGTKRNMYINLTHAHALEICEDYGWQVAPDGGYVWDLEIEEMDEDENYVPVGIKVLGRETV